MSHAPRNTNHAPRNTNHEPRNTNHVPVSKIPLLSVSNLTVVFDTDDGQLTAVDDVGFRINKGEIVGVVGESGCGKSVTAMSILRLIPSPPGKIVSGVAQFEGEDLLKLPISDLRSVRGNDISVIFQEPMTALSPLHRVGTQLIETLRLHDSISKEDAWQIGTEWLGKVGIPDAAERMHAYPFELSGGMRQRVMIAMALILKPKLLIADEPTTALDVTIQAQIMSLIQEMVDTDTSVLLITHDMGVIWEMCDRVLVMYASRIVEEAPVKEIFANPLHPYTKALLQSMPSLTEATERLNAIDGQVPSPLDYPCGCHFADRCPSVMDRCRSAKPALEDQGEDRKVACFLYDK